MSCMYPRDYRGALPYITLYMPGQTKKKSPSAKNIIYAQPYIIMPSPRKKSRLRREHYICSALYMVVHPCNTDPSEPIGTSPNLPNMFRSTKNRWKLKISWNPDGFSLFSIFWFWNAHEAGIRAEYLCVTPSSLEVRANPRSPILSQTHLKCP